MIDMRSAREKKDGSKMADRFPTHMKFHRERIRYYVRDSMNTPVRGREGGVREGASATAVVNGRIARRLAARCQGPRTSSSKIIRE